MSAVCFNCLKNPVVDICGRCKAVGYCSDKCRTEHWDAVHRSPICKIGGPSDPSLAVLPLIWTRSEQGRAPTQQDIVLQIVPASDDPKNPLVLIAVIDGHGLRHGHLAATIVRTKLSSFVYRRREMRESLLEAFQKADDALLQNPLVVEENALATCAAVIIDVNSGNTVLANVGDCGAWILRDRRIGFMSNTHRWNRQSEKERVASMATSECWIDLDKVPPDMVYQNGDTTIRLNLSRALGPTKMRACGVIATPDVSRWYFRPGDHFMVGSSGMFSLLSDGTVQSYLDDVPIVPDDREKFGTDIWSLADDEAQGRNRRMARLTGSSVHSNPFEFNTTLVTVVMDDGKN